MEARGINMTELARRAKLRPNTLTNWKSGRTANPRKNDIASVCQALGVRPEWLVLGHGPMDEPSAHEAETPYRDDSALLGQCFTAVLESLDQRAAHRPPAAKIGAVMAEVYALCLREGKQPTPELVAPFIRVLLA